MRKTHKKEDQFKADPKDIYLSYSKLSKKKIVDILGYVDAEDQDCPFFHVTHIVFNDGTEARVEGTHDCVFLETEGEDVYRIMQEILEENWREDEIWED